MKKESTIRRRVQVENKQRVSVKSSQNNKAAKELIEKPRMISNERWLGFFNAACYLYGIIILIIAARYIVWYFEMLHENLFWFSHIKEVEREISFRTEQGLYYSFYKQLVNTEDFSQGISDLKLDNKTEYGNTINVLQRFNIYQEVILAYVYKVLDLQRYVPPIMFYTKVVFVLQSLLAVGLYLTSWTLGHSHLAGLLTLCFFIAHKNDASRVDYSVPLRECFSLPFVFCQLAVLTHYLKPSLSKFENFIYLSLMFVLTLLYTVTWQFAQFISLLQSGTLFILAIVNQADTKKVVCLLYIHFIVMFMTWILHFGNPMLLTSLLISFIPFAVVFLKLKERMSIKGIFDNIIISSLFIIATVVLSFISNFTLKFFMGDNSDQHIFKFIKGKLGLEDPKDFESRVYLCNEAFGFLDFDTYKRLSASTLFPVYCILLFFLLSHLVYTTLFDWEFPNKAKRSKHLFASFAFNGVQSVLLALVGSTTRRMICLWVPHMCIVTAAGLNSSFLWNSFGQWTSKNAYILRRLLTTLLIVYFLCKIIPFVKEQMEDLNEFWDPDTVELMEWIKSHTAPSAAFAGSMQLMAGVKLCTGRPITNHPHFEDKLLRQRTIQIYQMYSKQPPEYVYKILKDVEASYVILEDSLCLPSDETQCHIVDILDLHNGHIPEHGPRYWTDLKEPIYPRFCDQIREAGTAYSTYFRLMFSNKTFRIYKVLR